MFFHKTFFSEDLLERGLLMIYLYRVIAHLYKSTLAEPGADSVILGP